MHIESSSRRGQRTLDASVNIVPYIDLLMTIMTFLVITATWTQMRSLESQSASGACAGADCKASEHATVTLTQKGIHVGAEHFAIDDVRDAMVALVATKKTDLELHVDDGVAFARVVALMDAAKSAGFKTQSLAPRPQ